MTTSPHVRSAVSSICHSVQSLGVDITPSLLKSAADGGDVSAPLRRSLHDLVILILAGFPSSGGLLLRKFWHQIELETITSGLPTEGCQLITSFLRQTGYMRADILADSHLSDGRELLLALVWLLVHENVLEHVCNKRIHQVCITSLLPPYPADLLQSREASEAARCGRLSAHSYVQDTLQACADKEGWAQVQVMSDCALLQYNKVWAKIRALQSLNQSRQTLIHHMGHVHTSIQGATSPHHQQTRLTLYEAALLRDSEKLERHQQSLEAAAGLFAECQQAMHSAQTFFTWAASMRESWQQAGYLTLAEVPQRPQHCQESGAGLQQLRTTATSLQLKLQDAMQQARRSGATCFSANQAVPDLTSMPTLRRLQHDIMSSQTAPCDGRVQGRHRLPDDIQDAVEAIKGAQASQKVPWAGIQLKSCYTQKYVQPATPRVVEDSACSAADEVCRLRDLVISAAKVLAKTRAQNKHVLQQAVSSATSNKELSVRL